MTDIITDTMTDNARSILCVTNRKLCAGDFSARIREIAQARPAGIILREKDLPEADYRALAREIMGICGESHVPCILHTYKDTAAALGAEAFHAPLPVLRAMTPKEKAGFRMLGTSCHSVADAEEAERLGCTYIVAGHIFDTDCKKGLPGRGLHFLREVCRSVSIPVYAIGGITPERYAEVRRCGASGACVMSGLMKCEDVGLLFSSFQNIIKM